MNATLFAKNSVRYITIGWHLVLSAHAAGIPGWGLALLTGIYLVVMIPRFEEDDG